MRHADVLLGPGNFSVQVAEAPDERVQHQLLMAALHQRARTVAEAIRSRGTKLACRSGTSGFTRPIRPLAAEPPMGIGQPFRTHPLGHEVATVQASGKTRVGSVQAPARVKPKNQLTESIPEPGDSVHLDRTD